MSNPKPTLTPALLRLRDLMTYLGIGRTAIYALRSDDPHFPTPVAVGKKAVAWKKFESGPLDRQARTGRNRPPPYRRATRLKTRRGSVKWNNQQKIPGANPPPVRRTCPTGPQYDPDEQCGVGV